jgi:hypothetical protein
MNNRIKMTDAKFKCNIFLFLSVTVFMARLSIMHVTYIKHYSWITQPIKKTHLNPLSNFKELSILWDRLWEETLFYTML